MNDDLRSRLNATRYTSPAEVARAAERREVRSSLDDSRQLLILAADHAARGVIDVGSDRTAMANRLDLLDRLTTALEVPGVDGVLASTDIIEDLLLLGALDGKVVFGSMNRGGLAGAVFEMDDRFTGYTPESIVASRLDGGKMLLRINLDDPGTANTLSACAGAISALAAARRVAMVEPFMSRRIDGRVSSDLSVEAVIRSMAIASALGATSAFTWLKVPVLEDMTRVADATTLPLLLLGGARSDDPDAMFASWERALALPGVRGLVVGRNLLYPRGDDVAAAVKTAASLL
ncbi:MAG: Cgl0159 family (beta/alpha)8-fold protein [Acidimicrobiales bacterium]